MNIKPIKINNEDFIEVINKTQPCFGVGEDRVLRAFRDKDSLSLGEIIEKHRHKHEHSSDPSWIKEYVGELVKIEYLKIKDDVYYPSIKAQKYIKMQVLKEQETTMSKIVERNQRDFTRSQAELNRIKDEIVMLENEH